MTTATKERHAYMIASACDRLAYLVNPYEYFDVVGTTERDMRHNVQTIARDVLNGNADYMVTWLREQANDENNDPRDRERAANWLYILLRYMAE